MKIVKITSETILKIACDVSVLIKNGDLTVIPADTAYALSTNALDENAVKRLYEFKGRKLSEPVHIFVKSISEIEKYAFVSNLQRKILQKFLPGPYTFILKKKKIIPDILTGGLDTIGVRIPDCEFISKLCQNLDVPFTATSSNRSGYPTAYCLDELISQYEDEFLSQHIPCIVKSDLSTIGKESSIIDITNETQPRILRSGSVDKDFILSSINNLYV